MLIYIRTGGCGCLFWYNPLTDSPSATMRFTKNKCSVYIYDFI